jgi:hypothetical protein
MGLKESVVGSNYAGGEVWWGDTGLKEKCIGVTWGCGRGVVG